jgi:mono/diheme cytochrome c family protein
MTFDIRRLLRRLLGGLMATVIAFSAHAASCTTGSGYYTKAEAQAGKTDYDKNCASCHNGDLSGNSGPALAGPKFESYLKFTKITPPQLLDFITSQMPANAPGSLSKAQYNDIFAYILSYDHYPSGSASISPDGLACLHMLPYPVSK